MAFGSLLGFRNAAATAEVSNPNVSIRANPSAGSWGSSGAETVETIPANTTGYIQCVVVTTDWGGSTQYPMMGLTTASNPPSAHFNSINYASYLSGSLRVYENGANRGSYSSITNGDIVGVHRDGATGVVTYKKNGTTVHTSGTTNFNELKGDFAFFRQSRSQQVIMNRGNGDFNPFYQNKVNITEYS